MCAKSGLLLSALLLLSVPCFSQSFDPEKVYQVPGKQLNRLEADFLKARNDLTESQSELTTLKEQLTTVSELLKKSESQMVVDRFINLGIGASVGAGIVVILVAIFK